MPNNSINVNSASVEQLTNLQREMGDADFASGEIKDDTFANGESRLTKQLYARNSGISSAGQITAKKRDLRMRWRIQQGKKETKNILSKYVGSSAAQKALNTGTRGQYDNSKIALSKAGLGQTIKDAHQQKLTQSCDALPNSKRLELLGKLNSNDFVDSWRDGELGPLFKLQAEADIATENFEFLAQCHDYQQLIQEYDSLASKQPPNQQALNNKLGQIREKAAEIGDRIVNDDSINVGSRERNALAQKDFANLSIDELKGLNKAGRSRRNRGPFHTAVTNMQQTARDVRSRLVSAISPGGSGIDQLRALRDKMGDDDHLRGTESTLYIKENHSTGIGKKWNHAKTHFWGGKRVGKFTCAKQKVQAQVADILGGGKGGKELAARIMAPYNAQSGALTKAQLSDIIAAADRKLGIDNQIQTLANNGNGKIPFFNDIVSNQPSGWTEAFGDYCHMQGTPDLKATKAEVDRVNLLEQDIIDGLPEKADPVWGGFQDRDRDNQSNEQFKVSQTRAKSYLQFHKRGWKSDLPDDLRNDLDQFVNLDGPPRDTRLTDRLRSRLRSYRDGLLSETKDKVSQHFEGFHDIAQKATNRAFNARNNVQQVQQQILQPQIEIEPQSDNSNNVSISDNESVNNEFDIQRQRNQSIDEMSQSSDQVVINMNSPSSNNMGNVQLPLQPTVQMNRFQSVQEGDIMITRYFDSNASSGHEITKNEHRAIQDKISDAEIAQARGQTSLALDLIQEAHNMAVTAVSRAINPEVGDRITPDGTALPQQSTPGNDE